MARPEQTAKALLPGASVFPSFTAPAKAARSKPARVILPPLDTSCMKADVGVPMPAHRAQPGVTRYAPLLELLDAPGKSVAFPAAYKGAVMTASRAWAKGHGCKFAVRVISANECRLWRVA